MSLDTLKNNFPDFAKDTKLNLSSVLTEEGSPGLTQTQIEGIALASSYAVKNPQLTEALEETMSLEEKYRIAAKASAVIMAMNNVYYRFIHEVEDKEYSKLPAKLRMNILANPGIEKTDFEMYALAVSAINGCGMCMQAHAESLRKEGLGHQAIQSVIRIAAVINAAGLAAHF